MNSKANTSKELPEVSEQILSFGASILQRAKNEIGLIPLALIIGALIIFN